MFVLKKETIKLSKKNAFKGNELLRVINVFIGNASLLNKQFIVCKLCLFHLTFEKNNERSVFYYNQVVLHQKEILYLHPF